MIVLDTDVLSELTRPQPDRSVVNWLARLGTEHVFLSAVTEAEVRLGLTLMPTGRRQTDLRSRIDRLFGVVFLDRVLPFDSESAVHYAAVTAHRRSLGRPIAMADAMIAAICLSHGMQLATHNVKDFEETGVTLINPFAP